MYCPEKTLSAVNSFQTIVHIYLHNISIYHAKQKGIVLACLLSHTHTYTRTHAYAHTNTFRNYPRKKKFQITNTAAFVINWYSISVRSNTSSTAVQKLHLLLGIHTPIKYLCKLQGCNNISVSSSENKILNAHTGITL